MEFAKFAQILKPIIGGAHNTAVFTKTLFEVIIHEDYLSLIEGTNTNTLKSYYNGSTQITKIAKRIFPYIESELFCNYLDDFPESTTQRLFDAFKDYIEDIDLFNTTEKIAYYYESILKEAAEKKKNSTTKSTKDIRGHTSHDRINEKILKSGKAMANVLGQAIEQLTDDLDSKSSIDDNSINELNENDMAFLNKLRTDVKPLLIYCIEHDPATEATRLNLSDEINTFIDKWKCEVQEIKDTTLHLLTNDIMKVLSEYTYCISDKFLRLLPDRNALWFRNESEEEAEQLRNILQPEIYKKRCQIRDLYLRLYSFPEDKTQQNQTIVIQNGNNNVNLTNNGTININL